MNKRLAYPLWMLSCVSLSVVQREIAWCAAGGLVGLGVQLMGARAWRTPSGRLALANAITTFRLAAVAALPTIFAWAPRTQFVAVLIVLFALDGLDGWVAEKRREKSAFGATFDMETDALTVMMLSLLLWRELGVGPWVLAAGSWRYVYAASIGLVPSLAECPRSSLYRWFYFVSMLALVGAFVPWAPMASPLAAVATLLISVSFLHSMARSRAVELTESARP